MDSFDAIERFIEYWRNTGGVEVDPDGNCRFGCVVNFASDMGREAFRTNATIIRTGLDDGTLFLEEREDLVPDIYDNLNFRAHFVRMRFDLSAGSIRVAGRSPRLGSYQVSVIPLSRIEPEHGSLAA